LKLAQDDVAIFRLPRRWQIGIVAITVLPSCALLLISPLRGAPIAVFFAVSWVLLWAFLLPRYTVELRPDGVKLLGIWWLPWTDVREVRYYKVLGLPHLRVKQRRGFSWSIPLYFVGDRDLAHALIDAAAAGHPFRSIPV